TGKEVKLISSITLDSIGEVTLMLIAILFVQSVFSFIRVYTFSIVSEKALADLRKKIYERLIWLPMTFFDQRRVGELMSRITSDVSTLQDTFSFALAELLRQVFTLVLGTVVISFLAPTLTAFMLLTFPVLIILALVFGKYIRKLSRKTQDELAKTNVEVEESLQSISVVKYFTSELFEIMRYSRSRQAVLRLGLRTARPRALFASFVTLAVAGGRGIVG